MACNPRNASQSWNASQSHLVPSHASGTSLIGMFSTLATHAWKQLVGPVCLTGFGSLLSSLINISIVSSNRGACSTPNLPATNRPHAIIRTQCSESPLRLSIQNKCSRRSHRRTCEISHHNPSIYHQFEFGSPRNMLFQSLPAYCRQRKSYSLNPCNVSRSRSRAFRIPSQTTRITPMVLLSFSGWITQDRSIVGLSPWV